jgi:methylated-DNA-[protein]-cysteine S-methyltransferase
MRYTPYYVTEEKTMLQKTFYHKTIDSPVGALRLIASDKGLCGVLFRGGRGNKLAVNGSLELNENHSILKKVEKQMKEYFAGKRKDFDVPLDPQGTIFQMKAWKQLQKIPYGKTISYGEQAKRLGDAKKARAVGMANNRNPICIIVPCHRVIGASGDLTGFGGGLKNKEYLLTLERNNAA